MKPGLPRLPTRLPRRRRRRVGRIVGFLLALLFVGLGGWALATRLTPYPQVTAPRRGQYGAIHVHTLASDGVGDEAEIARAARRAGLGFVIVTDHNRHPLPPPRYLDGVLLVHGVELSTEAGHLLVLGVPPPEGIRELPIERALEAIERGGGLSILAHPVQRKNPWRRWDLLGTVDGLELYSADTMLREALRRPLTRLIPAAVRYVGRPEAGLMTLVWAPDEARERLEQLGGLERPMSLCSHDAHGRPPYRNVFSVMATHLPELELTDSPAESAARLIEALRAGQGRCVFRALGDASAVTLEWSAGARSRGTSESPPRTRSGEADAPAFSSTGDVEGRPPLRRALRAGDRLRVAWPPPGEVRVELRVFGPAVSGEPLGTVELNDVGLVHLELWRSRPSLFGQGPLRPWVAFPPILVEPATELKDAPPGAGRGLDAQLMAPNPGEVFGMDGEGEPQ